MSIVKEVKVEIQVIDDRLLAEGLITANADSDSPNTGEINLVDIAPSAIKLSMSFKNIGRIENLVGFDHLEKLCLDNNLLEEIVNLHHLKSLRWLDLSFNKIRKIQGLENLKNLEDLSLYCNKISIVENLDHCPNLQCLSLGNNRIDSLEQVIRLRQIRSLKMLTLSNNPIENNSEYRMTVLAYVDSLHYLDYAMIDKNEKLAAKEQVCI
jgi:Leucine-rich repeat (LRR) protein